MGSVVINNSVPREDASTLSGDTSSVFAAASIKERALWRPGAAHGCVRRQVRFAHVAPDHNIRDLVAVVGVKDRLLNHLR